MADDVDYDADSSEDEEDDESELQFWINPDDISDINTLTEGENSRIDSAKYKGNLRVALKVLPGSLMIDAERQKINRQVRILMRANHGNIVKFIGATVDNDLDMVIVLEFIPNCVNLEEYLRGVRRAEHEVMTLKEAVTMGIAISEAMEFLHAQNIMHRNLKPSNILVTEDCSLKLTGFSNAREVISDEEEDIEPIIEGLAMRAIAKSQFKQMNGLRLDVHCFGQIFHKILKDITSTGPKKRMHPTGPLYLSSSEEEYPYMEDIPEQMVEFLKYCFEGQSSFRLLNESLETVLRLMPNEEQSHNPTTSADSSSVLPSGNLQDWVVIDPRDILQGASIATTPSAIFYEAMYQTRYVLVQVFQPDQRQHVEMGRRQDFNRIVHVLSGLEHPNIVQFIGSCVEPSLIILTEFMEGGTLEQYLLDLGTNTPPIRTALNFALGLSSAMQHLHSTGIVHRGLKSSNVFLTKDKDLIKLGGFGNAREEKDLIRDMASSSRAMENNIRKADIFDFSRILYELLTNKPTEFEQYVSPSEEIRPSFENVVADELLMLLDSCTSEEQEERVEFEQISNILEDLLSRNPGEDQGDEWKSVRDYLSSHRPREDSGGDSSSLERLRKKMEKKNKKKWWKIKKRKKNWWLFLGPCVP